MPFIILYRTHNLIVRGYNTKNISKNQTNSDSWFFYYQLIYLWIATKDQQHKIKMNMHEINSMTSWCVQLRNANCYIKYSQSKKWIQPVYFK